VQSGGTPKEGFTGHGVPFLKVYNIVGQRISFDYRPQYIATTIHNSSMKKSVTLPGDVLMNIVGPPLGKVAIVPDTYPEWNINQAITLFRPSRRISSEWLYYVLCSGKNVRNIILETRGMVGQQNISLSQCRNFVFPVPPVDEQAEIVRRVGELFAMADALERAHAVAIAKVEGLVPSTLAKAFRGELVAQDPDDKPVVELLTRLKAKQANVRTTSQRRRHASPPKRMTMNNNANDAVKAAILKLKVNRFSFDDLRTAFGGDYESLKTALFELLEEPNPIVRQIFDKKSKSMRLERVTP
jgi:type I restriction enzyme S subunit